MLLVAVCDRFFDRQRVDDPAVQIVFPAYLRGGITSGTVDEALTLRASSALVAISFLSK